MHTIYALTELGESIPASVTPEAAKTMIATSVEAKASFLGNGDTMRVKGNHSSSYPRVLHFKEKCLPLAGQLGQHNHNSYVVKFYDGEKAV
jgi:hypothetical protein